jgi:hypothetical protein
MTHITDPANRPQIKPLNGSLAVDHLSTTRAESVPWIQDPEAGGLPDLIAIRVCRGVNRLSDGPLARGGLHFSLSTS